METHKQDAMNFYAWSNVKWPSVFDREPELSTMAREPGKGIEYTDFEGGLVKIWGMSILKLTETFF